jgi:L-serine dehydratase
MPRISVFDMLKIGVGPSSSHTLGPWRAAERFLNDLYAAGHFADVTRLSIDLYGSLAKTGRGHGTDVAVLMGLQGEDPVTCDTGQIGTLLARVRAAGSLNLRGEKIIPFDVTTDMLFHFQTTLPFHPNGIRFTAYLAHDAIIQKTYYSIGGGFVMQEGDETAVAEVVLPYPCDCAEDVLAHCQAHHLHLWQMVWENEKIWRNEAAIRAGLRQIRATMVDCVYRGCHTPGELPGGLHVQRRAAVIHQRLIGEKQYADSTGWLAQLQAKQFTFQEMVKWVSCFALAVNEENAAFGRVVTAPTNGAAGVIPAVLMYYLCQHHASDESVMRFLLVAGELGSLFKKGATISAALGGCQAEIGVSSAMAAAALTECLGGTVEQALMAAEIAMEHHLGLTCDPVGGLVQIPCIERNAMGAMKAITAANIALESIPQFARVSLDTVIKTMWQTALDMNDKYKETAEGGLAVLIPVNVAEC